MTQPIRIFLQYCGILYRVAAHKITTDVSISYVIHIDENDSLHKRTGIKLVIFEYTLFDKKFLHPKVSYRHYDMGIFLPDVPFVLAVIRGIQMQEEVYKPLQALDATKQSRLKE